MHSNAYFPSMMLLKYTQSEKALITPQTLGNVLLLLCVNILQLANPLSNTSWGFFLFKDGIY